jgi:hypothetical protein
MQLVLIRFRSFLSKLDAEPIRWCALIRLAHWRSPRGAQCYASIYAHMRQHIQTIHYAVMAITEINNGAYFRMLTVFVAMRLALRCIVA